VTLTVADEDADRLTDAHVEEDTQVLHFRRHRRWSPVECDELGLIARRI